MNIIIGGDFFPGRGVEEMAKHSPAELWGDMLPHMAHADLRIVNLECPLTVAGSAIGKSGPNLKAHPDTIRALKAASFDLITLANNHIYDYGQRGLEETLEICRRNRFATVGAGLDAEAACTTWYKQLKGKQLAVVNFSENEWCNASGAHGGANPYDLIENARQIREARDQSDVVLVIIHGGHEHYRYPSPRMVKEYRFFAEQGASAVIGHHTHCVSGFEVHGGVPIFYSLGNLLFDSNTTLPCWFRGMLLNLFFNKEGHLSWRLIPYSQSKPKSGIWTLPEEENVRFFDYLEDINYVIAHPAELKAHWEAFVINKSSQYVSAVVIPWRLLGRVLNKLGLAPFIAKLSDLKLIHNLIRCESHRDLLLSVLKHFTKINPN